MSLATGVAVTALGAGGGPPSSIGQLAAYDQPGHVIVAAGGDSGFTAASFPASSSAVVSVGGTALSRAGTSRGWAESARGRGGSGYSAYVARPSWQHDTSCRMRTVADVAAVAGNVLIHLSEFDALPNAP